MQSASRTPGGTFPAALTVLAIGHTQDKSPTGVAGDMGGTVAYGRLRQAITSV